MYSSKKVYLLAKFNYFIVFIQKKFSKRGRLNMKKFIQNGKKFCAPSKSKRQHVHREGNRSRRQQVHGAGGCGSIREFIR